MKPSKAQRLVLERLCGDGFIANRDFRKGISARLHWAANTRLIPTQTFRVLHREGWVANVDGDQWGSWPIYRITTAGRSAIGIGADDGR